MAARCGLSVGRISVSVIRRDARQQQASKALSDGSQPSPSIAGLTADYASANPPYALIRMAMYPDSTEVGSHGFPRCDRAAL